MAFGWVRRKAMKDAVSEGRNRTKWIVKMAERQSAFINSLSNRFTPSSLELQWHVFLDLKDFDNDSVWSWKYLGLLISSAWNFIYFLWQKQRDIDAHRNEGTMTYGEEGVRWPCHKKQMPWITRSCWPVMMFFFTRDCFRFMIFGNCAHGWESKLIVRFGMWHCLHCTYRLIHSLLCFSFWECHLWWIY